MERGYWARRIKELDPATDFHEIYRILGTYEFPWDMYQSLGFALYRTYAVPSIGRLLAQTGELTNHTQRRYDDTVIVLDAILQHGLASETGRTALRRMNQMHEAYDISNDDKLYVLCTFVVVPTRWLDRYGWRPLTEAERTASANYYRELGQHMGIKGIPVTHQEFAVFLDRYEENHFGYRPGRPGGFGGHAAVDGHVSAQPADAPVPGRPVRQGADGRPAASRVWLPAAAPVGARYCVGSAAAARRDSTAAAAAIQAAVSRKAPQHSQLSARLRHR